MDGPDKQRLEYEIAVLQHQQNLMELTLHQLHIIRRRGRRRRQRRFWIRPWIGRRRQFGLYDQLLVELRNEDQSAFKNFMRMQPEMFDELLTRVGPRITKQNTTYREYVPRPWPQTCSNPAVSCVWDQVSLNVIWVEGASQH